MLSINIPQRYRLEKPIRKTAIRWKFISNYLTNYSICLRLFNFLFQQYESTVTVLQFTSL